MLLFTGLMEGNPLYEGVVRTPLSCAWHWFYGSFRIHQSPQLGNAVSTPDAPGAPSPAGAGGGPAEPPRSGGPAVPDPAETPEGDGQHGEAGDGTAESNGDGEVETAADAIARPGRGSRRNEYLRDADLLTGGEGDAAGRGRPVLLIGQVKPVRLTELSPRQTGPVEQEFFVEPSEIDKIRHAFSKSRVVILRGPAGYGKQAIATRMLMDFCPGPRFQLDSAVDFAELAESIGMDLEGRDRIEQGAGFLLNQPSNFGHLYASVLQRLEAALDRADARLVMSVESTEPLPDQDLEDYTVNVISVPLYQDIVASRLRYRLSPSLAEPLLARSDVRMIVKEQLLTVGSCKQAADLADAIADAADTADYEDGFDVERIRSWKEQRGDERFDTWFASLRDTRTRSFAVALAVLDGLPYDSVAKAARALYRAFGRPAYMVMASEDDVRPGEMQPFRQSRSEWLLRLRAKIKETEVQGAYGRSTTEAVEYQDPEYRIKVIRRAWSDYEAQDALVSWLGKLARDDTEQVRIYAGMALGRLATWSFDFLASHVLEQWANSRVREQREAVAYALRVVASSDRLRGNAHQLISAWYGNKARPQTQATAARAYGVAIGPLDPAEAFNRLERLCQVDDIRIAIAVGDSVADLLDTGTDELACSILPRLAIASGEYKSSSVAQMVFLIVADGLIRREQEVAGQEPVPWPLLLHLSMRLRGVRDAVTELWRSALNGTMFYAEAGQVLTRWAATAEVQPSVREAFLRLARTIARGDWRTIAILERYCEVWSDDEGLNPLPRVSSELQAILAAEKES